MPFPNGQDISPNDNGFAQSQMIFDAYIWFKYILMVVLSLNIFLQQSESIGQQGKPYLKASGSEIVYSATYKQNYNKKVNK